ncbi:MULTISPECIES: transposase [unclassified Mesorhizobium]|uniref:transposase n=1 Tax=unclassified Mesorhizobium TaxID=325217 RepID=UPI0033396DB8
MTLARGTVQVCAYRWPPKGLIASVVDSTGLKFFGAGEWACRKQTRRSWRKLHISVNPADNIIIAFELTDDDTSDADMTGRLGAQQNEVAIHIKAANRNVVLAKAIDRAPPLRPRRSAPFARIRCTAALVSRPPEKALPTRSPNWNFPHLRREQCGYEPQSRACACGQGQVCHGTPVRAASKALG